MISKDTILLGSCTALLLLYFISLALLAFQWNVVIAIGVAGVGIVSWVALGYWLLERLIHQG